MKKSIIHTLTGASIYIAILNVFSKALGFLREILFAGLYGLNNQFDIYLVSAVIPMTINVILFILAQNYLIPNYSRFNRTSNQIAKKYIRDHFYIFVFFGLALAVILSAFANQIISIFLSNISLFSFRTARNVFDLLLISVPFTAAASVLIAYQQSNFEFKYSIALQIFPNIFIIIFVYFFSALDIYAIPFGFLVGTIFQLVLLINKSKELELFKFDLNGKIGNYVYTGFFSFGAIIIIETLSQFYSLADRYFYDFVPKGTIASMNYAFNLFQLPVAIISSALATAIFPKFSELFNNKNFVELEELIKRAIRIVVFIFIPISFIYISYGDEIIKIIFQRGNFTGSDTIVTYKLLINYSFGIVFISTQGILTKVIYGANLIRELLLITIIGVIIKFLLNIILVRVNPGEGLALSTSLTYVFFLISEFYLVSKNLNLSNKLFFICEYFFNLFNAIIGLILTNFLFEQIPNKPYEKFLEIGFFLIVFFSNSSLTEYPFAFKLKHSILNFSNLFRFY